MHAHTCHCTDDIRTNTAGYVFKQPDTDLLSHSVTEFLPRRTVPTFRCKNKAKAFSCEHGSRCSLSSFSFIFFSSGRCDYTASFQSDVCAPEWWSRDKISFPLSPTTHTYSQRFKPNIRVQGLRQILQEIFLSLRAVRTRLKRTCAKNECPFLFPQLHTLVTL